MKPEDQIRNGANPYGVKLAENISNALPKAKCVYGGGNIYLYLPDSAGYKASSKGWLYTFLDTLPEIDAPLERLQVIIYVNEAIACVTIINPSEFDAMAMDKAKIDGLSFSSDAPQGWNVPMPLDHPWYSDKDYFKKNGTLKDYAFKKQYPEAHLYNKIKDQPNVKAITDKMKKEGYKI